MTDVTTISSRDGADGRELLSQTLEGRAAMYRMLASLYFRPLSQEQIDALSVASFGLSDEVNIDFERGTIEVARYLRKTTSKTRQELAVDFTSSFGGIHTIDERQALPYRSLFMDESEPLLYAAGHREVFGIFKKACVKKREGLDYPDDHLSFLCEFMALLSDRCRDHLTEGDAASAGETLDQSRDFLEGEILSWFDSFSEVANRLIHTRFYRGVLLMSKGYFELDQSVLRDLGEEVRTYGS